MNMQHTERRKAGPSTNRLAIRGAVAFSLAAIAASAVPAAAGPSNTIFRQITNITTGTIESVKLRLQNGTDLAFVSNGDVMGPGTQTANRQIYVWREGEDGYGTLTQVTHGVGCDSYEVAKPTDTVLSDRPELIAFVSTCELDPEIGAGHDNADGNPEIFFYELDTGLFHQVTDTGPSVVNGEPFTSDSGRCLVFRSNGDLDNNTSQNPHYDSSHPGQAFLNPDGSDEIFLYGKMNGGLDFPYNATLEQVSNGPMGSTSSHPVINGYYFPRQCQTTAFQSDHDQFNAGHTGRGIYIYKMPLSSLEPITAAEIPMGFPDGIYSNPNISGASPFARGPHVLFESEPDLWRNLSTGNNIFDWRDFHPRMTQYTNVGTGYAAHEPQVGDGGGVIAISSNGELLHPGHDLRSGESPPFNGDHNEEIFLMEGRRTVSQLTVSSGCTNVHPSLKDDGNRLAFISDCDLITGINPTNKPQVFLYARERADFPLLLPDACLQAEGCCIESRDLTTCYHQLKGRKPKIDRPNCIDKPNGCDN